MKYNILGLFLIFVSLVIGCSKDEIIKNDKTGSKLVMVSEYNPDFFPEGDVEELMTNFFNEVIEFQEDSTITCTDYNLSEGGWYLTASLNYLCADAIAQLDDFEEYNFNASIELTGDSILELDGNSLVQCMLNIRLNINELNSDSSIVGAVQCVFSGIEDDVANFTFKAMAGNLTTYDDVTLNDPPVGVSPYATLKMGYPYGSFQSAATETRRRYNPYLYKSKMESEVFADKKYIVTNVSSNNPMLWTDPGNCFVNMPDNNYILYVGCSSSSQSAVYGSWVSGSVFNYYLQRFFQLKLTPMINGNLSYLDKTLYLKISPSWIPECYYCGYFNGDAKAVFQYTIITANATLISVPLPTI